MTIRRTIAISALGVGALVGVAAPAAASVTDPAYPPATPSPSVTEVLPSSGVLPSSEVRSDSEVASTEDDEVAVLGIRLDALPRTGAELLPLGAVGGVLVAGGVGAVRLSRRGRGHHS